MAVDMLVSHTNICECMYIPNATQTLPFWLFRCCDIYSCTNVSHVQVKPPATCSTIADYIVADNDNETPHIVKSSQQ